MLGPVVSRPAPPSAPTNPRPSATTPGGDGTRTRRGGVPTRVAWSLPTLAGVILATVSACASTLDRARAARASDPTGATTEALYRQALREGAPLARNELAEVLFLRAQELVARQDTGAERALRATLEVEPQHDAALSALVRGLRQAARIDEALAVIDESARSGGCTPCNRLRPTVLLERADKLLREGRPVDAVRDLAAAQKLRASPVGGFTLALAMLAAGDRKGALAACEATVAMMEAPDVTALQKFLPLREALALAQAAMPDLPEVHVAAAAVLSRALAEDLAPRDVKLLRRAGFVDYRGGVTRVGEALSELDWAERAIAERGPAYPFRAPWLARELEALRRRLRTLAAYRVQFQPEGSTILLLRNPGTAPIPVTVRSDSVQHDLPIPAGSSSTVTIPEPGPVTLTARGRERALLAEPYTSIDLAL